MRAVVFAVGFLATSAQAAMFQCEARIPWPGVTFLGQGTNEQTAKHDALATCRIAGHTFCFVTACEQIEANPG